MSGARRSIPLQSEDLPPMASYDEVLQRLHEYRTDQSARKGGFAAKIESERMMPMVDEFGNPMDEAPMGPVEAGGKWSEVSRNPEKSLREAEKEVKDKVVGDALPGLAKGILGA